MSKPDDLKERIARLIEQGKALVEDRDPPDAAQGRDLMNFVFPVVRRHFQQGVEPLRHNIDYQSMPRKSMLTPPFKCEECGGGLWEEDQHTKDPEACRQEKIRQVMES